MHLGFNQITSIQDSDFPLWITEANIESNRLTELINASCPENSSLIFLDLSGNSITHLDMLVFFPVQSHTSELKLTRMPLALAHLKGLKLLNVRDYSLLVCTCDEISLESWIKGLVTLAGECGISSFHDFYSLGGFCPDQ